MASLPNPPLTEEEYLHLERQSEFKSEYHDGQMFAMSGGSSNHSLLAGAIIGLLFGKKPSDCRIYTSDMRIYISGTGTYTYPDCSVVCGEPQLSGSQRDNLLNPLLIAEVLSPSTEGYDRGKKFELYRTIESLREYLLVDQDRRYVEHWSKEDDSSWRLREYTGNSSVAIARLNVHIALSDLYADAIHCD